MNGIIVDVKGKEAVILNTKGEFVTIKNKNFKIGERVNNKLYTSYFKNIAACFVLCMCFVGGVSSYYIPVQGMEVDANSSFYLKINIYNRVIGIDALNEEAEMLVENNNLEHYTNISIGDCISKIVNEADEMGYFDSKSEEISINIFENDKSLKKAVNSLIGQNKNNYTIKVNEVSENKLGLKNNDVNSSATAKTKTENTTEKTTLNKNIEIVTEITTVSLNTNKAKIINSHIKIQTENNDVLVEKATENVNEERTVFEEIAENNENIDNVNDVNIGLVIEKIDNSQREFDTDTKQETSNEIKKPERVEGINNNVVENEIPDNNISNDISNMDKDNEKDFEKDSYIVDDFDNSRKNNNSQDNIPKEEDTFENNESINESSDNESIEDELLDVDNNMPSEPDVNEPPKFNNDGFNMEAKENLQPIDIIDIGEMNNERNEGL